MGMWYEVWGRGKYQEKADLAETQPPRQSADGSLVVRKNGGVLENNCQAAHSGLQHRLRQQKNYYLSGSL